MIETIYFDMEQKNINIKSAYNIEIDNFIKPNFYDTEAFHLYHNKCIDKVYRIFFVIENKFIGYCYVGIKDKVMKAPYSAPFSMIYTSNKYRINDVCNIIKALIECSALLEIKKILFSLPSEIYSQEIVNLESAAFYSNGFKIDKIDINNYFDLSTYENKELYIKQIVHASRKNYNISIKNDLHFIEIPLDKFELAYNVIKINREEMGNPLNISKNHMEDLLNMNSLTCRCFGVMKEDFFIATAIIFDVTDEISQVIYWGDISSYRNIKPMALLTTEIFDYYKKIGKKYLDIGISSEDGIINAGLADFKKSIGCSNNIKITFRYEA